uniref:Transposase Tc1-like domain-containing protein n=1 Tax=Oryzias latipes TaxID=8090 RepID=A0A3B3H6E9_ORYLA
MVGRRQSDAAGELGESQSVINRLESRQRTTGRVCDRPKGEALPVTDHNHDQNLRTSDLRYGLANATQLQAHLPDGRGTRVSRHTIHNRLHPLDWNDRRPLQVTPLTPRHLQWKQDHVTWTMQQWSTILFTDECRLHGI